MDNSVKTRFIGRLGKNGQLEEVKPMPELPIGLRVYSFGAGMSQGIYCVSGNKDSYGKQQVVLTSSYFEEAYFGPIHYLDKHTRPISEKFGIGFYYDDVEQFIYPMNEVLGYITRAEELVAEEKRKAEEKSAANKKEIEELPAKFPHLMPIQNNDYKIFRANIVADLKHNFPEYKFNIRKHGYDSMSIEWENGLSVETVKKVLGKYDDHSFDHSGDYYDYTPSNFNKVFGGMKFISTNRNKSDSIRILKDKIKTIFPDCNIHDCEDILHRLFYRTDIPVGASNFDIKRNDIQGGSLHELIDLTYDLPQKKDSSTDDSVTPGSLDLKIVEYSEKSFAVYGDTKVVKKQLSKLGGAYNRFLKDGPGYIFSKKKQPQVVDFVNQYSTKNA